MMERLRKIFLVLLFLMPFFQGLYFYFEIFIVMVCIGLLLILSVWAQRGLYVERSFTSFFLAGLFILYLLTCFYGIDGGTSLFGALKMLLYFMFYLLYTQLYTDTFKEKAIATLTYSCLVAAILGILSFFIPFLSDHLIQKERLGGIFQYANTYGLYCIIGLILIIRQKEKSFFHIWAMLLITAAMVLTFSRSILIISAIVLFISILHERKHWLQHALGIGFGGMVAFAMIMTLHLEQISSRIGDTSLHTSEWVIRLIYYKDALKMIARFPFGTGYLGYSFIERTYQTSSQYLVKFVHSNLLQYALDIGVLGALFCCVFFMKQLFSTRMDFLLKWVLVTIVFHGFIDFDFEFPMILLIVLLLGGVNLDKISPLRGSHKTHLLWLSGCTLLYVYMSVVTLLAYDEQYQKAYTAFPLYKEAKMGALSQIKDSTKEGYDLAIAITKKNDYVVEAFEYLRDFAMVNKAHSLALFYAKKSMALNPLNIKQVEMYSNVLLKCSEEAIKRGNLQEARSYLQWMGEIPEMLEKLAKARVSDYNIRHAPSLTMTQELKNNDRQANRLRLTLNKDATYYKK